MPTPVAARAAVRTQPALLSVVIPCFNESEVLPLLRQRLTASLDGLGVEWEAVFIDDGSVDDTWDQLSQMHGCDRRFKAIAFSRNFGHQTAVAAGLAHARGEVVAVLDADLQDPPELLAECLEHWRQGDDVVYCVRKTRKESPPKRLAYAAFYRLLRSLSDVQIPFDSGDFCVMDRRVVDVVVRMPERHLFMRGMRAWAGFRQRALPYDRPARAAGETKYPLVKLLRLASDGIFSFTVIPLRLAAWLGAFSILGCAAVAGFVLAWRLLGFRFMGHMQSELPGWAGIILLLVVIGSMQMTFLGIIGEYIGRIYEEIKGRPRWVVRSALGLDDEAAGRPDVRRGAH
jgi:dolichol-phosphate mannosyltransferase